MKLKDKGFGIFEAMSLLASLMTVGLSRLLLGPMDMGTFLWLTFALCLPVFLIGQALAWKIFKQGHWLMLGFSVYLYSIVVIAAELALLLGVDFLYSVNEPKDISADEHVGFAVQGIAAVILWLWLVLSLIPSLVVGALSAVFRLIPQERKTENKDLY